MDRAVRHVLLLFAGLFLALIVNLTYVQVYAAPRLATNDANSRGVEQQMRVERGVIVSADGVVLADNRKQGDYFLRIYPQAGLAEPWLGYSSLRYGRAGLERAYNPELSGDSDLLSVRSAMDLLLGRPKRGADLRLTVNAALQRAAIAALGDRKGAVVALDPRTGAILAMASYPTYDPRVLEQRWKGLNQDEGRPLLNRATQGLYPPGSSFKPVIAAAALSRGTVKPDTVFVDTGRYLAGGYVVRNFGDTVYGRHSFADALIKSINTTFARIGVELGASGVAQAARSFGFGEKVPGRLAVAPSRFPEAASMDTAHVAQASFGQGEVLATPLEMALVAAGIANGGRIMTPYLVAEVRDYQQSVIDRARPSVWMQATDPATAATLRALMLDVVQSGTGTKAAIPGVEVAGKTGTAELDQGEPHAWFIGFAPAADPRVAVAVIVEHGGTGGTVAAPVAKAVIQAALGG